jgi:putative FmdB family regulatory protein
MPAYKYFCNVCNTDFIVNSKMSNYKSIEKCPICNTESERETDDLLPQNYICKTSGFYGKTSK